MEPGGERAKLLEAVDDGPMDPHARIVADLLECDVALVTVMGQERQHHLGCSARDGQAPPPRRAPRSQSLCEVVATTGAPLRVERLRTRSEFHDHPARTERGVEAYLGVPLRAPSGAVVGAVCGLHRSPREWSDEDLEQLEAMRDLVQITLRPLLRSQQDRTRAEEVTLLLSTLRHELGGELAIVLGGIETAMLPSIDETVRTKVLSNARRDCRRVISTLDALLRVDSRAPAQLREVRLDELVTAVADGVSTVHATGRISLDVEACQLVVEAVLLEHVVRNLLDNACKYAEGEILVAGTCDAGAARITVADHGPGIRDDVAAQLFSPYSRAATDSGASGFGLGLYIVRNLCQRLGATLDVDTGEDGTTITVTVPDRQYQSPKPSNAASSSEAE